MTVDTDNGSHVTWRELNLVLGPMREDIGEVKTDVKLLLERQASDAGALAAQKVSQDGRRFWTTIAASLITALVAGALSSLLYIAFT